MIFRRFFRPPSFYTAIIRPEFFFVKRFCIFIQKNFIFMYKCMILCIIYALKNGEPPFRFTYYIILYKKQTLKHFIVDGCDYLAVIYYDVCEAFFRRIFSHAAGVDESNAVLFRNFRHMGMPVKNQSCPEFFRAP